MNEGFVVSDKNRRAVFVELVAGETDIDRIVKKHRLIRRAAERALEDLRGEGIVAKNGAALKLTAEGEKLAVDLKRKDLLE
ncbi:MAG TPA: hypothetical protein VM889_04750 [Candidatus Thermoplasmatota archaeon]|nr:hypothetical protein [Candidatus Thermoplasmatota archaeon]